MSMIKWENRAHKTSSGTGRNGEGADDPGEIMDRDDSGSPETADYLRRVLVTACDGRHKLSRFAGPYDGFSRRAYEQVYDLLGMRGRSYLGISSSTLKRLTPKRSRVQAIPIDEANRSLHRDA